MSPHDEERFAKLITDFVTACGFAKPFHLVTIDSRGSATVTKYDTDGTVQQVCQGPERALGLKLISPLTLTVVDRNGAGKSAKLEVVQPSATVQ